MKKYKIYAFDNYGIFVCREEKQATGEIYLIGKFKGKRKEYLFIKNERDILINQ